MEKLEFETGKDLVLQLEHADQDAAVEGWEEDRVQVTIDGSPDQCTITQQGNTLNIQSEIALAVRVPNHASVEIGRVFGDLLLRDLDGSVSVTTVHGDFSWRSGTGPLSVSEVHGDLAVDRLGAALKIDEAHADVLLRQIHAGTIGRVHGELHINGAGAVNVGTVSGDVQVKRASDELIVEAVRGDFEGRELLGGMNLHMVQGDFVLRTPAIPGMSYKARAGGSVIARFPADTSARFTLEANGTVSAELPQIEEQGEGRIVGRAGAGEAEVMLSAGGDLRVHVRGASEQAEMPFGMGRLGIDFSESLSAEIEGQIAEHLGKLNVGVIAERDIDRAVRRAEREVAKAQRHIERETARAEERARRAEERATRAARKIRAKLAHRSRQWGTLFSAAFAQESQTRKPEVSEEEELAVLKLLQENKISVEQAEMLLDALQR